MSEHNPVDPGFEVINERIFNPAGIKAASIGSVLVSAETIALGLPWFVALGETALCFGAGIFHDLNNIRRELREREDLIRQMSGQQG